MKALLVDAPYPLPSSKSALKDPAAGLRAAAGHETRISDLSAMNRNPVTSAADFGPRLHPASCSYAPEQLRRADSGAPAEDIHAEIGRVEWGAPQILNFSTLWFSLPAVVGSWIDRVFVSGRFYGGMRFHNRGGMSGRRTTALPTLASVACRPCPVSPRRVRRKALPEACPVDLGNLESSCRRRTNDLKPCYELAPSSPPARVVFRTEVVAQAAVA